MHAATAALRPVSDRVSAVIPAAAEAVGGTVEPVVTLIVAVLGFLGVTIAPIITAYLSRSTREGRTVEVPPEVAIPRPEYDALTRVMADQDEENDRLVRDLRELRERLDRETERRIRAETRLEFHGEGPPAS